MGNLLAFEGYENVSVPFNWQEYDYLWKGERRYHDFHPGNEHNASCKYPRMWGQDGFPLTSDIISHMDGCRSSEFDMVRHCQLLVIIFKAYFTSTETSRVQAPTRVIAINFLDLHQSKTDYENGEMTFLTRLKSCPAYRLLC